MHNSQIVLILAYIPARVAWLNAIGWRSLHLGADWMKIVHVGMTLPDGDV